MNQADLLHLYMNQEFFTVYQKSLEENPTVKIHLEGLKGSSRALISAAVFSKTPWNQLVILPSKEDALFFLNDLQSFLPNKKIHFFPSPYKKDRSFEEYDKMALLDRTEVLNAVQKPNSHGHIILTYPEALCEKVVTREKLIQNTFTVTKGDRIDIDFIIDFLIEFEFERTDFVYEPGTFSIRGGIVDIYSYSGEKPYRIELDEDVIESVRTFDPETQLSQKRIHSFTIIPNVEQEKEKESWIPFLEFLPKKTVLFYNDLRFTGEIIKKYDEEAAKAYAENKELFAIPPEILFETYEDFLSRVEKFPCIDFGTTPFFTPHLGQVFDMLPQPAFNKNFNMLAETLKINKEKGYKNLIFSEAPKQVERIYAIFEDIKADVDFSPIYKRLHEGFTDHKLKLACFTEHQIFNRYQRYKPTKPFSGKKALTLKELQNLSAGDFVTHIDHGIGVYKGLQKIEIKGRIQEAVRLEYKGGDLLYVNIHSLHKISKFSSSEGKAPAINKLGTNKWENLKKKTKTRVKDIARDLIKLYAQRRTQEGFRYSPDSYLQTELEASFLYEDTPDQGKATEDVKRDMESEFPMDRLICGDVGFGKTEIAMRAAFKAVTDSKQVAVLVPTTVLTLQHAKTFRERFADFPVTVDYISRFRSKKQQTEILKRLAEGKIDVIIGTHRLAGKDIKFKNLGLLIIDEEQKFGVAAKEKLKALKTNVDTLTMTATPIPRTLQFSLMGARDLSVINTPPPNRQAVETTIETFDEEVIQETIEREINRGGQVFFVHNRIRDIYEMKDFLSRIVPQAKVGVGHGQMEGRQLEEVMMNFVEGYYDILLSTSIIESGLDISNANTIIINQAQNFGLSDLYQMRGRVGRSNKKAYALLITPPKTVLTQEARRRLSAIEEFSELGSGFQIAMRDLDIRGAGNLLGGEQSGFIAEIGFEMYQKILDEAIQELKDTEFKELFKDERPKPFVTRDCQIETDMEILIPDHYVINVDERLSLYSELNRVKNEEQLLSFMEILIDRFGPLPSQTRELLDTVRLKWVAMELGIEKIILKNKKLKASFMGSEENNAFFQSEKFGGILKYVQYNPQKCRFDEKNGELRLEIRNIKNILEALTSLRDIARKNDSVKIIQ